MDKVYAFQYTNSIYESNFTTISLHRTKKGAYMAMKKFLNTEYALWRDNNLKYGKDEFKFGYLESWKIVSIDVFE